MVAGRGQNPSTQTEIWSFVAAKDRNISEAKRGQDGIGSVLDVGLPLMRTANLFRANLLNAPNHQALGPPDVICGGTDATST